MRQRGQGSGPQQVHQPSSGTHGGVPEPVVRADHLRARQAADGTEPHPQAALFAARLAHAVAATQVPAAGAGEPDDAEPAARSGTGGTSEQATEPGMLRLDERADTVVLPALRDAVFGGRSLPAAGAHGIVPLPAEPALICDRSERVVRVNAALLRLVGTTADERDAGGGRPMGPLGMRLPHVVLGPDADARLVRADGSLVRVRAVRWELPDVELSVVVLVELKVVDPDLTGDRQASALLERLAGVGTWTFELATGMLRRSEALSELYRSAGLDPEAAGSTVLENDQVTLLCRALRSGSRATEHRAELRLPAGRVLRCRAEVLRTDAGTPVRLVGVVRDHGVESVPQPDQSARRRVEHAGRRFADLMALAPGGIALLDRRGRVIDANAGLCELLGVPLERLRGTAANTLTADGCLDGLLCFAEQPDDSGGSAPTSGAPEWPSPAAPGALPAWLQQVSAEPSPGYRVDAMPLRRADGTTVWCKLAVSVTLADDGAPLWLVACTDVTEQRRAAELLRSAGTVDELTRLPNRAASLALVDRLLAGPDRDRVAVVCGDLDDFARVNSSLGHDAGDELLVTLAGRLQRELPVGCTAARLSGDEFVVICADHAEVGGPDLLARTVADLLRSTLTVNGRPVQMTASVGLATPVPTGDVRAADLLRFAEAAMHDVKRTQRRGGIGMATDGVVSSATQALELEAELRATIAGGGLTLVYQPVVGPDGTVLSAEALVRWPHPERGLISPAQFLPVAQRSGLLRELDLWVLRAAASEAATWPAHRGARPAVAVNLAGLLPGDVDFLSAVADIVEESGLAWDALVLELVETSLVALPPHALAAMAQLVERGVRFAVDDFGTGYSSLARLKELPAQTIKVDRAFVTGVGSDPADFAVARAVVDMAQAMGRTTVAEGVETAEQFHVLRGIGVDAFQGWLFARPLPPHELHGVLVSGQVATPAVAEPGL